MATDSSSTLYSLEGFKEAAQRRLDRANRTLALIQGVAHARNLPDVLFEIFSNMDQAVFYISSDHTLRWLNVAGFNLLRPVLEQMGYTASHVGQLTGKKCYDCKGLSEPCPDCIGLRALKTRSSVQKTIVGHFLPDKSYEIVAIPLVNGDLGWIEMVKEAKDVAGEQDAGQ